MSRAARSEILAAAPSSRPLSPAPAAQPETPTWDGRTGTLAYVAKMFPRISETFILREILALKQAGIPVQIYSLLPPTRDSRVQPEALPLLPEVRYLAAPGPGSLGPCLAELGVALRGRPGATLKELTWTLLRPTRANWRRFLRGLLLAR